MVPWSCLRQAPTPTQRSVASANEPWSAGYWNQVFTSAG